MLELLGYADHPQPPIEVTTVIARARLTKPTWTRWVAGGLFAVGLASAAYAIPGSPVRGWLRALADRSASPPAQPVAPPAAVGTAAGGVAVVPGSSFEVRFLSLQTSGEIRVTLTDGPDLVVQARSAGPSFTSNPNRLIIDNRQSAADFDIAVPRSAARVEIRIGERRVFVKAGSEITTATPFHAPFRISLTSPTP